MPDFLGQAIVAADGTAHVDVTHQKNGIMWIVEQVTSQTGRVSSAATTWITMNGTVVAPSAALTPIGNGGQAATAGGLPYVYLSASDTLSVNVQGASAGDTLTIRAQYQEVLTTDPLVRGR